MNKINNNIEKEEKNGVKIEINEDNIDMANKNMNKERYTDNYIYINKLINYNEDLNISEYKEKISNKSNEGKEIKSLKIIIMKILPIELK
jgi:hypothetical protein